MWKHTLLIAVAGLLLAGFSMQRSQTEKSVLIESETSLLNKTRDGTVMQIVRLKSALAEEDLLTKAHERKPQFEALPGLLQKFYVRLGEEGSYCGVYIWDSAESLKSFRESELAATIGKAYEVTEAPSIEIGDIMFKLRD